MLSVKVCPKCGSENVKIDTDNVKAAFGLSVSTYKCLDCLFSGPLFPEIEKEVPHTVPKDSKKQQKEKA